MKDVKVLLKTMPWKHKVAILFISILSVIVCIFTFGPIAITFKYVLFLITLLVASYFDVQSRMIPDWIHIILIIIGLMNFDVTKSVIGLLISPLPFLIMALINTGSIGGGDIKLIGASGFVLGYGNTTTASIISIVVAVCFYSMYYLSYQKVKSRAFPFAPFFQVGCMIVIVFGDV